jgi:hypothetical protein
VQVPSPRSRPGWPSVRRRRDLGAVGPPSGWSPARGCPRRRPGRSLPCPPPLVRRGDVRPAGRADVQCPGRPVSGVQASGHPGVRTDKLRCPRRCRHVVRAAPDPGVARCGGPPPVGPSRSTCPVVGGGAWSPAASGRTGKGMVRRWPWLARMRSTVARAAAWPASRLRRRLGPSGPARALVQARVPAGGGEHGGAWEGAGAHQPRQGVLGALIGVVPTTAWPSSW